MRREAQGASKEGAPLHARLLFRSQISENAKNSQFLFIYKKFRVDFAPKYDNMIKSHCEFFSKYIDNAKIMV